MDIKTRAFVLAAASLLLPGAVLAQGRVGVTSQTEGDPLGKPPTTAERILRVGIDIQANEIVTTRADDRAHLVFLDGTSLTVSPNAQLVIDKFVYDPNSKTGDLSITATAGVFRLVGGKISKVSPITINTPSATMGVRGGIGVFEVNRRQTTADFLFGTSLTVTANGQTQTATRPGSMIVTTFGGTPGAPALIPNGALAPALAALEAQGKGAKTTAPDDKAKQSGFSASNSGQSIIPNQNTLVQATQANSAIQAVSTVNQQHDVLTAQPVTTTTAAVTPPVATTIPPPATSLPPFCPPPIADHDHDRHMHGRR
jgi:hypothetical protein